MNLLTCGEKESMKSNRVKNYYKLFRPMLKVKIQLLMPVLDEIYLNWQIVRENSYSLLLFADKFNYFRPLVILFI